MNDKFFDLKKEKQDRMINGALKVFAQNGYKRASTDEIVAEAGISKGLLFHYFVSKLGLYSFVYEYSVRYMLLELSTFIDKQESNYFTLTGQRQKAVCQVLKNYPYMKMFLDRAQTEDVFEALEAVEDQKNLLQEKKLAFTEQADFNNFRPEADPVKICQIVDFTMHALMEKQFVEGTFQPDMLFAETGEYLKMMAELVLQK
ncbi:MAG: helix-turn-helix domain containing protein [Lachnospiraceae bacterium]|nr:helix-turn-helix domain containing protein [Lachnospiraceae bacterium]